MLVDSVLTKHQDSIPMHVLFVATTDGIIKKLSYNPRSKEMCLVEVLHPFSKGRSVMVHNMKLWSYSNAIYLATEENVVRLPIHRCKRFRTQRACLNSMDPYCGWNKQTNECTSTPNNNPRAAYWQQSLLSCPILSDPVSNALRLSNDGQIASIRGITVKGFTFHTTCAWWLLSRSRVASEKNFMTGFTRGVVVVFKYCD